MSGLRRNLRASGVRIPPDKCTHSANPIYPSHAAYWVEQATYGRDGAGGRWGLLSAYFRLHAYAMSLILHQERCRVGTQLRKEQMLKKAILVAALVSASSGCASVRFESPSHQQYESGTRTKVRYTTFAWGLVPGSPISLDQCGEAGIKKMKVKSNWVDGMIAAGTAGFLTPTRVIITCAQLPKE